MPLRPFGTVYCTSYLLFSTSFLSLLPMASKKLCRSLRKNSSSSLPKSPIPNPNQTLVGLDPPILDPLPSVSISPPAPLPLLSRFLQSHLPRSFTPSDLLHFLSRRLRHHPSFAPYDLHVFLWAPSSSATFRHDHSTFEFMARSLASSSRFDSLRLLLRLLPSHPCPCSSPGIFSCPRLPHIYRAAVSAFARAGRVDDAAQFLADARRSVDGSPDPSLYNLLIHAFTRLGDHSRAVEWYHTMLNHRVKPDAHTFNILINSTCRNSEFHSAAIWFREMKARNLEPNVVSFNTLIMGFFREKRFQEGIGIAHEMLELGFRMSSATCEILIHGLCRDGRNQEAYQLLMEFLAKAVVPEEFDCFELVELLCEEGKIKKASELVGLFWEKGKAVSVVTCTTLIEELRKSGEVDEAYGVMQIMLEKGMLPDRITFNCLLEDLCGCGRTTEANKFRVSATSKGLDLDGAMFTILVQGFAREGRRKEGERVVDEMLDAGFIANIATYNTLMEELQNVN